LYNAFGWEPPKFAHLPLLLNPDKSKLSKRQGSVAVEDFIELGYFKEAFVNFVALLGWNPTGDREIYTIDEFIEFFALEKVNKGGAVFDRTKLEWMNFQYLKNKPAEELATWLTKELNKQGLGSYPTEYLIKVVDLVRERVNFVKDIPTYAPYLFSANFEFDEDYKTKHWKETTADVVKPLIEEFKKLDEFTHDSTHDATKGYCEAKGMKLKEIIHPLRLMLTGKSVGAGMFETMAVLGKEECISRMESALAKLA
jgi:glutamyl-tRNA synthetase